MSHKLSLSEDLNPQECKKEVKKFKTKVKQKPRIKLKSRNQQNFSITYRKIPSANLREGSKTFTQRGCGEGDVLRYVRDEYITELEQENKKLRMKVGVQINSLHSKEKHLKAAQNEKKQLKNELRTLRSKAYEKNVIKCHLEQHCTAAQASKLLKPEKKYYRKFDENDMKLAAELKSMSTEAYDLVREKSILCIPGNKTLKAWLKDNPEYKSQSLDRKNVFNTELEEKENHEQTFQDYIENPLLKNFCYEKPSKVNVNVKSDTSGSILQLKKKSFYQTIDYFDTELGTISNKECPSIEDLALSLLRELMLELGQRHYMFPKLRLGILLLHLGTRASDFTGIYKYYRLIERESGKGNISWFNNKLHTKIQESIIERVSSGDFSFDPSILPHELTKDDEVMLNEDQGDSNFLLTIVDEQNYDPDHNDLTVINDDINDQNRSKNYTIINIDDAVKDKNMIMQTSLENIEAEEEDNTAVSTVTDQNSTEREGLEFNTAESITLEHNAYTSMTLEHNADTSMTLERNASESMSLERNAAESMSLERNATESMSLERNAAESMVLLTFSSGQNRWISDEPEILKKCLQSPKQERGPRESSDYQKNKIKVSIQAESNFISKSNVVNTRKGENMKRKIKDDITVVEEFENCGEGSCPTCDQKVSNYDQLDRHLFLNHNLGVLCQECGIPSDSFESYKEHSMLHKFECNLCQQIFIGVEGLSKHTWFLHTSVNCDLCNKSFSNRVRLKTHKTSCLHNGKTFEDILEYRCALCMHKSGTKQSLIDHVQKVHTAKKPKLEVSLSNILPNKTSNNTSNIKLTNFYDCSFCNKIFGCCDALKEHETSSH